jgi:hypothetical protein
MLLSESNHHCLYFVSQIILEKYPKTKDWPCNIVPWEKTKDLPEKDCHLLFLALAKMDNWETVSPQSRQQNGRGTPSV